MYTLDDIPIGGSAAVTHLCAAPDMRRRLLELGFSQGTRVQCVGKSPMGDPKAFLVRGSIIALRSRDCKTVAVSRPGDR